MRDHLFPRRDRPGRKVCDARRNVSLKGSMIKGQGRETIKVLNAFTSGRLHVHCFQFRPAPASAAGQALAAAGIREHFRYTCGDSRLRSRAAVRRQDRPADRKGGAGVAPGSPGFRDAHGGNFHHHINYNFRHLGREPHDASGVPAGRFRSHRAVRSFGLYRGLYLFGRRYHRAQRLPVRSRRSLHSIRRPHRHRSPGAGVVYQLGRSGDEAWAAGHGDRHPARRGIGFAKATQCRYAWCECA